MDDEKASDDRISGSSQRAGRSYADYVCSTVHLYFSSAMVNGAGRLQGRKKMSAGEEIIPQDAGNWGGEHKILEFHEYANLFSGRADLENLR